MKFLLRDLKIHTQIKENKSQGILFDIKLDSFYHHFIV